MHYSLGIDIGTSTVKCVLFKEGPKVVAESQAEHETLIRGNGSYIEQDPLDWWNCTVTAIRQVLRISRINPKDIKVISVSSQAPCVLPVGRDGNPLYNALIWMDRRSQEELNILNEKIGAERIYEITGNRLDTYFTLTELMWLQRHEPELMEKCYKVLQVNGYINYCLTGRFTIDISHASLTQIFDIKNDKWSSELLSAIGTDDHLMPEVVECSEMIGHVTEKTAAETGLSTDTAVLGGMVDATAAALEVGVVDDGQMVEMTGTSSVIIVAFNRLVTLKKLSYLRGHKTGSTLLFGAMNSIGGSLKWFRDALYGGETPENDAYNRINREIEEKSKNPSKLIYLPFLAGERAPIWNPNARGTFIGMNLNTTRADLMRSIMEGTCFALRTNLDEVAASGIPFETLLCCGGCSKSDIWLKIKASVINKEVTVPAVNLGAPGGLAFANAAYMGEFSSAEEGALQGRKIRKTVEPVKEWIGPYEEMYAIYKDSYHALKAEFEAIARL